MNSKNMSGIRLIEKASEKLSDFALEFISQSEKVGSEIFTTHQFKNLGRSQKDAIRYQIKKQRAFVRAVSVTPDKKSELSFKSSSLKEKSRTKKIARNTGSSLHYRSLQTFSLSLGVLIACVLIVDFVAFYQLEGLVFWQAFMIAVIVELCIVIGAILGGQRLKAISRALIFYNAIIFCLIGFSEFKKETQSQTQRESTLLLLKNELLSLEQEHEETKKDLRRLFERGIVTSSSKALTPIMDKQKKEKAKLKFEISKLNSEISSKSLTIRAVSLFLMVILRLMLQVFSFELIHRFRPRLGGGV